MLCAYLRLPYDPDPGEDAAPAERTAYRADREVRHTVIRVITAHLERAAAVSWQGLNFDFTGVVFDGGDFSGARFSGGSVDFGGAKFSGGWVDFAGTKFSGGLVDFNGAKFTGGRVHFADAEFTGTEVSFAAAAFSGGTVSFMSTEFSGGKVDFTLAEFSGGEVNFTLAKFTGGEADFTNPWDWSFPPVLDWEGTPPSGVSCRARKTHRAGPARLDELAWPRALNVIPSAGKE